MKSGIYLEYSEEFKLQIEAAKLRALINSGYGYTNKPIPPKRMEKLKRKLSEIEDKINLLVKK